LQPRMGRAQARAAARTPHQPPPGVRPDLVRSCGGPARRLCGHAPGQVQTLMRYISTRSGSGGEAQPIGFLDAVLAGLAPDGGLYVPEAWPVLAADEIAAFAGR